MSEIILTLCTSALTVLSLLMAKWARQLRAELRAMDTPNNRFAGLLDEVRGIQRGQETGAKFHTESDPAGSTVSELRERQRCSELVRELYEGAASALSDNKVAEDIEYLSGEASGLKKALEAISGEPE